MASRAGHPGPVSPETYWKRRVFVLAGLFAVVALIAWAGSALSSSDTDEEQQASADPEQSEESPEPEEPPDPGPTGTPDLDDESEDTASEEEDDTGDDDSAAADDEDSNGDGSGADIPEPESADDPCRPQDVVVTMELTEDTYFGGDDVEVELTVVNTGEQTCTVDVGPEEMELRVTSGEDRIYSTADCADDGDAQPEELTRGVPHTTTVTWDRSRSWTDCRDSDATADNGTYVLQFLSDYDEGVDNEVFRLR